MHAVSLASFFDQLDLESSADLLIAFHHLSKWPAIRPLDPAEGIPALETIEELSPLIFGQPDSASTVPLVDEFILQLGGIKEGQGDSVFPLAPREWLHVFRVAFARGLIGPVALGAAFRFLMVRTGGNGAPGFPADSLEARSIMLADARRSSPLGLMDHEERLALDDLPPVMTLYRGGRGDYGQTPYDRAQGLHWALDVETAMTYLGGRGYMRTRSTIATMLRGLAAFSVPASVTGVTPVGMNEALGEPFLIRARVPVEAVIAYVAAGVDRESIELFVDYERVMPDGVEDITPNSYRWAA